MPTIYALILKCPWVLNEASGCMHILFACVMNSYGYGMCILLKHEFYSNFSPSKI